MPDRIEAFDVQSRLVALAMAIYSQAHPYGHRDASALVAIPGEGEQARLTIPIGLWNRGECRAHHLLIAGHNYKNARTPESSEILNIERLQGKPYHLKRLGGVHCQIHAEHTRQQMEWVSDEVCKFGITSIALFVSPYHLLRAYLTLIKALMERNRFPIVIPVAAPADMGAMSPDNGVDFWTMVPGEIKRILEYQDRGWIATMEEVQTYLAQIEVLKLELYRDAGLPT